MDNAVLASFNLTGIDSDGAARVDDDEARRFIGFESWRRE
jgi:hypothetical protein